MISLRDMSLKTKIFWIQSDNVSNQYKSKDSFGLLQQLADEFRWGIIRTYGAAVTVTGLLMECRASE